MCIHGFRFARNAGGHVITVAYPLLDKIRQRAGGGLAALSGPQMHRLGEDEESAQVRLAFARIDSEYKHSAPHRDMLIESLLMTILVWMARNARTVAVPGRDADRGSRHFATFCELVEEGYAKHYPVAWYAKKIGITAAHLNVLCRQAVNRSALELIHQRMLLEARRSLVYTAMTVSVVSYSLGFSDPAYFTRFFKRATGLSPKEFRRQAKTMFAEGSEAALK
jgi:AraC family transcriptional activator of pobA